MFTPTHLGPSLFIFSLKPKFFNFWALLLGSIVMDFENVFWTVINLLNHCVRCDHHGFFHSILGAIVGSLILAFLLSRLKEPLNKISLKLKIEQSFAFSLLFFSSLTGWIIHIIFDSFVHHDVFLFWPIKTNPFLIHWALYWPLSWALGGLGLFSLVLLVIKYIRKHD
jgi:membrane-bound metal-dependent hydrolase YbcI (DUF457 family)